MENFRKTNNLEEILTRLNTILNEHRKVLTWQTIDQKRHMHHVFIDSLNVYEETLKLTSCDKAHLNIDSQTTLYIKGEYENILFKQDIVDVSDTEIIVALPSEIFLHEHRESKRNAITSHAIKSHLVSLTP